MWSVWSCVSMHVCLQLSSALALMNFPDGREGSICLILLYGFEHFHQAFVSLFVLVYILCLIAERLVGSPFHKNFSRQFLPLNPHIAVCLARSSAASFPTDPMCPATHVNVISIFCRLLSLRHCLQSTSSLWRLLMSALILSIRYWAGWGSFPSKVFIIAWLLMLKLIWVCVPLIACTRWNPNMIPTSLPLNTVCSDIRCSLYHSAVVFIPLVYKTADAPTWSL